MTIKWQKKIYNKAIDTYALKTIIEGVEAAFLNRPNFDTNVWKIRFDRDDYNGNPKILGITEEAFRWRLKFKKSSEVINYLKYFIPHYLKKINYDFNKIPQEYVIKNSSTDELPRIEEISTSINHEIEEIKN